MPPSDEDARAIRAVREGDADAFRTLVDRHGGTVYSILRRLLNDTDLAEELAQETFVRAYAGIEGFRGESGVGTWLVQIAVNLVRDRRRAEQRAAPVVSLDRFVERGGGKTAPAAPAEKTDPLRRLVRRDLATRLEKELQRLPEEYREVFLLKHVEGLSYETIARMTGDSVGTLKVRAHRSRMKLRERLAGEGTDTEERHGRTRGTLPGW